MSGRRDGHRSHVPSKVANNRSVIPPVHIRNETKRKEVGTEFMADSYLYCATEDDLTVYNSAHGWTTTTSSGTGDYYYPYQAWGGDWDCGTSDAPNITIPSITTILKEEFGDIEIYII